MTIYNDNIARPYVYKITFLSGEYYYGYRFKNVTKFNRPAHLDLGIKYFSSSTVIKELDLDHCIYEILSEYDNSNDAYWAEQRLIKMAWGDALLLNANFVDQKSGNKAFRYFGQRFGADNPAFGVDKTGEKNPNFNSTIYHWIHIDGREEYCTKYTLQNKFNLIPQNLSKVIHKQYRTCNGWSLYEDKDAGKLNWINIDGRIEFLTPQAMQEKHKLNQGNISQVVNNKKQQCCGWSLL